MLSKATYFLLFSIFSQCVLASDRETLLSLKTSIDPSNSLRWKGNDFCKWEGVKQCLKNKLSKLVLESKNLSGTLDPNVLNQLDQIRVLSFKNNSISGQIPNLFNLTNLKSLYLSYNNFSGEFPVSLTTLHRLKTIVLSGNQLSGNIPNSILNLQRLHIFYLDDNKFAGIIPPFNQTSLKYLNLSENQLTGVIPATGTLLRFNSTSFSGNVDLCGESFHLSCGVSPVTGSPAPAITPMAGKYYHRRRVTKIITIIAGFVGGFSLLCVVITLFVLILKNGVKKNKISVAGEKVSTAKSAVVDGGAGTRDGFSPGGGGGDDGTGVLVFTGGGGAAEMSYRLDDLLKASAETLGRGTVGSTYKAVMETGFIVTVKRLIDATWTNKDEFCRHVEVIGRLRHKNLVPIRAYLMARGERLVVYDYFPNGSLFTLIHGSKTSGRGKPLHWTSCLKIAEDLASGLLHIHQKPGLAHGNIKSSNVLLGSDFESCFTDYGLIKFKNPNSIEESSDVSLFYRAPECRDFQQPVSQKADVYSFGVLLLELLTGKTPSQDLVLDHGADLPTWVKSIREEESESGGEPVSSGKLAALLSIALACVSMIPENRPVMQEVLRMIKETRMEQPHVSSNSSDHSPGRWSDTVQSVPRDDHLSI
uniref:inactive leucine-rich repeat receptor-like serine/threonine-protein kinase At1g60630 n=1 Tax=Erigeron canadensis TaxID=72917 RepID=UPI001CB9D235|nr:inactive leucine-rich repeat receptor-like serine/threonine-protein kinase At1g60630 [Erigeron canadensis]